MATEHSYQQRRFRMHTLSEMHKAIAALLQTVTQLGICVKQNLRQNKRTRRPPKYLEDYVL